MVRCGRLNSATMSTVYDCGTARERTEGITAAATAVRSGRLVVLPTDTVYGIGADAFDTLAVRSLLEAKRREPTMPVGVLIGSWSTLDGLAQAVPFRVRSLIEAFWPGDLSVVIRHAPSLMWDLGDSRGTVMLRMPLHPVALELLREVGPMAVSSANVSGRSPASTIRDARDQFDESVAVYLDGGTREDSRPSTIVDLTGDVPLLLREGAVSADAISEVLGMEIGQRQ